MLGYTFIKKKIQLKWQGLYGNDIRDFYVVGWLQLSNVRDDPWQHPIFYTTVLKMTVKFHFLLHLYSNLGLR